MSAPSLLGLKVLVVEDEAIVSFLIEEMLMDMGCAEVWHAGGVTQALEKIEQARPDLGVLDVNLSGTLAYPVAERLAQLRVPFFFATGYGKKGLAPEWAETPVIQKPFDHDGFGRILSQVIAA
ncbi:MAG TPA: response regulator [Rhizomicrobium sp.]|jgi:CheY-like chemotaxis protein|nr:response regulator [Rhizomicrobium sp.]